jgi:hypothetical protein
MPPQVKSAHILAFLHEPIKMHNLNPIIKSHKQLDAPASIAFFASVPADLKPPATGTQPISEIPVFSIIEASSGTGEQEGGSTWRGGWAKRFIPDEIKYETSLQNIDEGMITITHAPMGVNSVTRWLLRRSAKEGEGLVVLMSGVVTSNKMLMAFIKTTIQGSYDRLADEFKLALEKEVEEGKALDSKDEEENLKNIPLEETI